MVKYNVVIPRLFTGFLWDPLLNHVAVSAGRFCRTKDLDMEPAGHGTRVTFDCRLWERKGGEKEGWVGGLWL